LNQRYFSRAYPNLNYTYSLVPPRGATKNENSMTKSTEDFRISSVKVLRGLQGDRDSVRREDQDPKASVIRSGSTKNFVNGFSLKIPKTRSESDFSKTTRPFPVKFGLVDGV
jgi:hypothetical protein